MEEKKEKKKMSLDDLLLQLSAPIGLGLRPEEQEEEETPIVSKSSQSGKEKSSR